MLKAGLAPWDSGLVHSDLQLQRARWWEAAATVLVLVERAEVLVVVGFSGRGFDQGVDDDNQQNQYTRREDAGAGNPCLHLERQEHENGHGCQVD